jgi:hypothetical protein
MQWNLVRGTGPRKLPEPVQQVLISRFHLSRQSLENLRMVEKWDRLFALTGAVAEVQRVKCFKVFDPAILGLAYSANLKYDDLKTTAYRQALQFEGHVEKDSTVHVADRRPPRITTRPISLDTAKVTSTPHISQVR